MDDLAALAADEELPRSASELSVASSGVADRLTITAFNHLANTEIVMTYPHPNDGWLFRADVSSGATLRWELNDTLVVVTRHSTCDRAIIPREKCRNCVMKRTWRKQCSEKCDAFFVLAMENAVGAAEVLAGLIKQERPLPAYIASCFVANMPSNAAAARRSNSADWETRRGRTKRAKVSTTPDTHGQSDSGARELHDDRPSH